MLNRIAAASLKKVAAMFPAVCVTGPRQSGKTTLCRMVFGDKPYLSFEDPDTRERFQADPRGFLAKYDSGAIFDEAQRCPELFSYLQGMIDNSPKMGRFILTGSQQFHLTSEISQSLAGRAFTLELLPFCCAELEVETLLPPTLNEVLLKGLYPPIFDRPAEPTLWYSAYVRNYVERDVRALLNIQNLDTFQRFIRLLAARVGQLINLSELGIAAGVNHNTVKAWISVLEASYIVFTIRPFHTNFSTRLVKTSKIYFFDPGLLCWLLSIRDVDQLDLHPMRGGIFESFVCAELLKCRWNALNENNLFFWRDRSGHEVDLILDHGLHHTPVEIKSGKTFQTRFLEPMKKWKAVSGSPDTPILIYGGDEDFVQNDCEVLSWRRISLV